MWVQIAILVASYLIQYATAPKPKKPKPAAFADFNFPRSTEGTEKSVLLGRPGQRTGWCFRYVTSAAGPLSPRVARSD